MIKSKVLNCFAVIAFIFTPFIFSSCFSTMEVLSYMSAPGEKSVIGYIDAVNTGIIKDSVHVGNISEANEEIEPSAEYAIGRVVAANILNSSKFYDNKEATEYVNKICATLAINSPMPYLYKGYFVGILDSDDINAIATPGGHIFISKGLIEATNSEDALAAVIAHELSHIQLGHSKSVITGLRGYDAWNNYIGAVLSEASDKMHLHVVEGLYHTGSHFLRKVTEEGFSKSQEYEADKNALKLMSDAGYNPYALLDMLEAINYEEKSETGWNKTHPAPESRIYEVKIALEKNQYREINMTPRKDRFSQFKEKLY